MLHIVKSPLALEEINKVYLESDAVILIQDAVYAANPQHNLYSALNSFNIFALQSDLEARGVINQVSSAVNIIDYDGFVTLTAKHRNSLTWD
ncbi:sulfurtransferase TusB [Vibrio zhanjiangensis]|uniref:Sulfurtransferase TusB n=1 Tax=Vibrio zhanjiangensis TaxID=1046128 RepID=A0ABQ6ETP0_9VIBR|nr:sulfurtransferase complex subunit TusB [Vibrio zhanjiangensis]GLT16352.1 sulfurtransferase TusB [Vibrio zhanjiangensis]